MDRCPFVSVTCFSPDRNHMFDHFRRTLMKMKRFSSNLLFLLIWLSNGCQDAPGPVRGLAHSRHVIDQLDPFFDGDRDEVAHNFRVLNDTGRQLRFRQVVKSCSCTNAILDDTDLNPGQATTLHLQVRPGGRFGPQSFSCRLVDDDVGEWLFELKAMIYRRVEFEENLYVGNVDAFKRIPYETKILFRSLPGSSLPQLLSVRATNDLTAETAAPATEKLPNGVTQRTIPLQLTLGPQSAPGRGEAELIVKYGLDEEERAFTQKISWNVVSLFEVVPPRVFFSTTPGSHQPTAVAITISRRDKQKFNIMSVDLPNRALKASIEAASGRDACIMKISLEGDRLDNSFAVKMIVRTDHPVQPDVVIPVAGFRKR
jgi:Protein of unknown function (DUF1573)